MIGITDSDKIDNGSWVIWLNEMILSANLRSTERWKSIVLQYEL